MAGANEKEAEKKKRRRHRCCTAEDDDHIGLCIIPEDALVEILVRLPLSSVIRCKFASKAWRRLISHKSFPIARVSNLPMTHQGGATTCQSQLPYQNIRSRSTSPRFTSTMSSPTKMTTALLPASPLSTCTSSHGNLRRRSQFTIFGSCNDGLILCWIRPKSFLVVNPSNQIWILLPAPPTCCLDYLHGSRHSRIFLVDLHIWLFLSIPMPPTTSE